MSAAAELPYSPPGMYTCTYEMLTPAANPRHLNYCMKVDQPADLTFVPADDTIPGSMWLDCRILKILHSGEFPTLILRNTRLSWRSLQLLPLCYFDADYER